MGIYKSLKINLVEADIHDSANVLMKNIADEIETAFAEFEGKFQFGKPDGSTRNNVHGEPFIESISYEVYFDDLSFAFEVRLDDVFSKGYNPEVIWRHLGSRGNQIKPFSVDAANKLAEATKIAYDLKSKLTSEIDEFINANPFPEDDGGEDTTKPWEKY